MCTCIYSILQVRLLSSVYICTYISTKYLSFFLSLLLLLLSTPSPFLASLHSLLSLPLALSPAPYRIVNVCPWNIDLMDNHSGVSFIYNQKLNIRHKKIPIKWMFNFETIFLDFRVWFFLLCLNVVVSLHLLFMPSLSVHYDFHSPITVKEINTRTKKQAKGKQI